MWNKLKTLKLLKEPLISLFTACTMKLAKSYHYI